MKKTIAALIALVMLAGMVPACLAEGEDAPADIPAVEAVVSVQEAAPAPAAAAEPAQEAAPAAEPAQEAPAADAEGLDLTEAAPALSEAAPADDPEAAPADAPEAAPASEPEEVPADAPEEIPADGPEAAPAADPEEIPADDPEDVPAGDPEDEETLPAEETEVGPAEGAGQVADGEEIDEYETPLGEEIPAHFYIFIRMTQLNGTDVREEPDGMSPIFVTINNGANVPLMGVVDGWYKVYEITPERFGFERCTKEDLVGGDPAENAQIVRDILSGQKGHKRNTVLMNAGAALYIAGKAETFGEGIMLAGSLIDSGAVTKTLDKLIEISNKEI